MSVCLRQSLVRKLKAVSRAGVLLFLQCSSADILLWDFLGSQNFQMMLP